ncbi:FkbM family methyltransferase [Ningiella sp. W23]|uniref:FkbM family methyltransferase n=1 Tax=Ningiella sp. W23 TaxID=3023715 RepID=UPI0037577609
MMTQIDEKKPNSSLFTGHAINDEVVVPGAYYLQVALSAQQSDASAIYRLDCHLPVFETNLDEAHGFSTLVNQECSQTTVVYKGQSVATIKQKKLSSDEHAKLHNMPMRTDLPLISKSCSKEYQRLHETGNQFSDAYRKLENMRKLENISQFSINAKNSQFLHVLDACFHSVLVANCSDKTSPFVLLNIEECQLIGNLDNDLTVQVECKQHSINTLLADLTVASQDGKTVFWAKGIRFCALTQNAERTALVQGNFTLAQVEEVSSFLSANFNLPYEIKTEGYIDWRYALGNFENNQQAYDHRFIIIRPKDMLEPQPLASTSEQAFDTKFLPNGIQLAQINEYETDYLYREIFVDRCYGRHGIAIENGDTVLDIGANIGMFSLYALNQAENVKIYAFEPSPKVADCLRANLRNRGDVTVVNSGVAEKSGEAEFSFYPKTSVFSSFFSAAEDDQKILREVISNQVRKMVTSNDSELIHELTEAMLKDRLEAKNITCPLINLSQFIREKDIQRIGLLKIDAEKAELGILRSLSKEDFSIIRQICLEVHDAIGDKLEESLSILKQHGFHVHVEEEVDLSNTGLYTVTATRKKNIKASTIASRNYGMRLATDELKKALLNHTAHQSQPLYLMFTSSNEPSEQVIIQDVKNELLPCLDKIPNTQITWCDEWGIDKQELFNSNLADDIDVPFSSKWYGFLSKEVYRALICKDKTPHKLIVVDADNTLWKGVVGENGVKGIEITKLHLAFQAFLIEQHSNGVMLALCSKNVESDIAQVFDEREEMLLKPHHFIDMKANWQKKSINIHRIAESLSISLDSVVFVDDNQAELAEVTGTFPQVLVLQFKHEKNHLAKMMNHWAFTTSHITEDDKQRSTRYLENQRREAQLAKSQSFDDFLSSLGLEINVAPLNAENITRVAQLTQRTNQFNATKHTYDPSSLHKLLLSNTVKCITITARDKFGDYGLVGAAFISVASDNATLENIVLSCRALGRGIEERFLSKIGTFLKNLSVQKLTLKWKELERNQPLQDFYTALAKEITCVDDTYYSALSVDTVANLKHLTREKAPKSAASTSKSAGLSLKFIDQCYCSIEDDDALVSQVWPEHNSDGVHLNKADALEIKVARIWYKVLGKDIVDKNADFFEIGGSSLRLIRVLSLIHQAFLVKLSLFEAFEHKRTIAQQAAFIRAKQAIQNTIDKKEPTRRVNSAKELTENQLGIYFSQLLNSSSSAYNVPMTLEIDKSSNPQLIKRALVNLGDKHPILKLAYKQVGRNTEISQLKDWFEFSVEDVSQGSADDIHKRIQLLASKAIRLSGPLLKCHVLEKEDAYIVVFVLHHLACDLASMEIFLTDFIAELSGKSSQTTLKEYPSIIQETDDSSAAFWKKAIQDFAVLDLPVSVRSSHQLLSGDGFTQILTNEQSQFIESQIGESGVSRFVYLFGLYCRFLQDLTATSDFLVATPVCLRETHQTQQIGNFVNLLPIRVSPDFAKASWPKIVENQILQALEHKSYPFGRIIRDSGVKTDTGRAPLAQTTFAFHDPAIVPEIGAWFGDGCSASTEIDGKHVKLYGHIQQMGQTDIAVEMFRVNGRYALNVKYDTNLLCSNYARKFLINFINFMSNHPIGEH